MADVANALLSFLESSRIVHFFAAGPEGSLRRLNRAAAARLGLPEALLQGRSLYDHLAPAARETLRSRVHAGGRAAGERFLLNFVDSGGRPYTLECQLAARPDGFVLLGEPSPDDERTAEELMRINGELSALVREHARQQKQLGEALRDLHQSHWHLKKLQEVLPICLRCARVKTGELSWEGVTEFFKRHASFLSHGYCPECAELVRAEHRAELRAADDAAR